MKNQLTVYTVRWWWDFMALHHDRCLFHCLKRVQGTKLNIWKLSKEDVKLSLVFSQIISLFSSFFFFTFHLTLSHKKSNNQFIECSTIRHLKLLTDDFRKEKSYTLIEQKNIFLLYTSNLILKNTRHNVNYDPHWWKATPFMRASLLSVFKRS